MRTKRMHMCMCTRSHTRHTRDLASDGEEIHALARGPDNDFANLLILQRRHCAIPRDILEVRVVDVAADILDLVYFFFLFGGENSHGHLTLPQLRRLVRQIFVPHQIQDVRNLFCLEGAKERGKRRQQAAGK